VKNSVKVAPSIISANMLKLSEEIEILERSGADMIHIDVYPLMVFAFEYRELANVTIGTLLLDFLRKRFEQFLFEPPTSLTGFKWRHLLRL
jgi:ribulose-phosphate 3-epimerase